MRVWVLYTYDGRTVSLRGVATDDTLAQVMRTVGADLRSTYDLHGQFRVVANPESYYRADERVYRLRWMTLVARPFHLPDQEVTT